MPHSSITQSLAEGDLSSTTTTTTERHSRVTTKLCDMVWVVTPTQSANLWPQTVQALESSHTGMKPGYVAQCIGSAPQQQQQQQDCLLVPKGGLKREPQSLTLASAPRLVWARWWTCPWVAFTAGLCHLLKVEGCKHSITNRSANRHITSGCRWPPPLEPSPQCGPLTGRVTYALHTCLILLTHPRVAPRVLFNDSQWSGLLQSHRMALCRGHVIRLLLMRHLGHTCSAMAHT